MSGLMVDRSLRVWAMRPDEAMVVQGVADRAAARQAASDVLPGTEFARVVRGVAVVPARGLLMRAHSAMFCSYAEILRDVALAQADPAVTGILLDIDSGGGLVAGCSDAWAALRASGPKPVHAFVGGMACSAAYHLATGCRRIVAGSGATVGSLGAMIRYVDVEPMLQAAGARIVRVVADQTPNKVLDPDSAEGRAELQALVDAGAAQFLADVAAGRGVPEADVAPRFGAGLVFDAAEAMARGMIDARGSLGAAIEEMMTPAGDSPAASQMRAGWAARATTTAGTATAVMETRMDWENLTEAQLREHRADLCDAIVQRGRDEAARDSDRACADAVAAERQRLLAIDEVAAPGFEALTAKARAEGWTPEAYSLAVLRETKAAGGQFLAQRAAADADIDVPAMPRTQDAAPTAQAGGTDENSLRSEWDGDANLRAEFGSFDTFAAFRRASADGRVRVQTGA